MTLKELIIFGLILFFTLFSRLFRLDYPASMYFDEVYHVPAAMMMNDGDFQTPFDFNQGTYDGQNVADWLHPPLAKYFQALSIHFLGKTPLVWRLPSLVFSMLSLVVFYFLVRFVGQQFFFKKEDPQGRSDLAVNLALLASFLLSLDGLFLVQSRIAMNDVFLLFFLLSGVFAYFAYLAHKRPLYLLLSGLILGLALATKWTAWWVILLLFSREFLALRNFKSKLPFLLFSLLFTPFFIYFLSYLPMLLAGSSIVDFLALQRTILLSHFSNPSIHLYSSGPLSWLFNARPVWYFAAQSVDLSWTANIYALDNPILSLYLLATFVLGSIFLLQSQKNSTSHKTLGLIFALYLFSFGPWLIFGRLMFIYHYLPALPFLIMLLSYFLLNFLRQMPDPAKRRAWTFNLLFWPLFCFVIFYPHWTALEVPFTFADAVYFFVPNWR